jgi:glycosyltransferase involved in cell wall biosynthesis
MLTYNHAPYIRQAIESVLSQKTSFPFELLIGDDCSTDGTRQIVLEYAAKYPSVIHPILGETNVGARENAKRLYSHCDKKYIALLDGDDYWTDENKLQKQVDFLEENARFVACGHKSWVLHKDYDALLGPIPLSSKDTLTLEDFLEECYLPCLSTVFRQSTINSFPEWAWLVPMGDWARLIHNATFGDVRLFQEPMGVYRSHGGIWSDKSTAFQYEARISALLNFEQHFRGKYGTQIHKSIATARVVLVNEYLTNGNAKLAWNHCRKLLLSPRDNGVAMRKRVSVFVQVVFPRVYHAIRLVKSIYTKLEN